VPSRAWWRTAPGTPAPNTELVAVVAVIAAYAIASSVIGEPWQTGLAVAVSVVGLLLARRGGIGAEELGLGRAHAGPGLRWGIVISLGVVTVVALAALLPWTRSFFDDDRYSDATAEDVAFDALVRIPIGTALFEEWLFRGVLLALLLHRFRPDLAVTASAALFGLWHVLPALGFADSNAAVADGTVELFIVPVTVVVTAIAGAFFAWTKIRSSSLIAPTLVHASMNSSAVVAAWLVG